MTTAAMLPLPLLLLAVLGRAAALDPELQVLNTELSSGQASHCTLDCRV